MGSLIIFLSIGTGCHSANIQSPNERIQLTSDVTIVGIENELKFPCRCQFYFLEYRANPGGSQCFSNAIISRMEKSRGQQNPSSTDLCVDFSNRTLIVVSNYIVLEMIAYENCSQLGAIPLDFTIFFDLADDPKLPRPCETDRVLHSSPTIEQNFD